MSDLSGGTSAPDARLGLTPREHRRLADVLLAAAKTRRPIDPLSHRYPELTIDDACRIRDTLVSRANASEVVVGAKSGPGAAFGWIAEGMLLASDRAVVTGLIRPSLEAKVALRLAGPPAAGPVTEDALLNAAETVLPALEVVDSHYRAGGVATVDEVADNCSIALVRLGAGTRPASAAGLRSSALQLQLTGDGVGDGGPPRAARAAAAPLSSLVTLAEALRSAGHGPGAGTLLLSAAVARPVELRTGVAVRARWEGLGTVELRAVDLKEAAHEHRR
jgi:2-keto-4-pentenoate hydratase